MNQNLMSAVERIVRPVIAPQMSKMRMREELYAHLHAIYEEELSNQSTPEQAVANATQRLGDSDALRDELQSGIPRLQQLQLKLDGTFMRKRDEGRLSFALRIGGQTMLIMGIFFGFVIPIIAIQKQASVATLAISFFVLLTISMGWNVFLAGWLASPILERDNLFQGLKRIIFSGFLFGISVGLTEFSLLAWSGLEVPGESWPQLTALAFFAGWAMFFTVVVAARNEKRASVAWESLELAY